MEEHYVLIESRIDPSARSSASAAGARTGLFGDASSGSPGSQSFVRRPMRGIVLKRETFATLSVTEGTLLNSSADEQSDVSFTSNFLLQSLQETRTEKFQAVTTFGASYGYFFGEQPRMISCQAVLLNTADFQWEAEWWENYDKHLRGTRLVDRGARVQLVYEDVLLEGYLISAGTSKSEPTPWAVTLSFSMWVTNVVYLTEVGAKRIDPLHEEPPPTQSSEYGEFTSDSILSEEARARNVQKMPGGAGLIGSIRQASSKVSGFTGEAGARIAGAVDWLYGRNMVKPPNNPRTELPSTTPFTIVSPVQVSSTGMFYENSDEYPARKPSGQVPDVSTANVPLWDGEAVSGALIGGFGGALGKKLASSNVLRKIVSSACAVTSVVTTGVGAQDAAALLANVGPAVDHRITDPFGALVKR